MLRRWNSIGPWKPPLWHETVAFFAIVATQVRSMSVLMAAGRSTLESRHTLKSPAVRNVAFI